MKRSEKEKKCGKLKIVWKRTEEIAENFLNILERNSDEKCRELRYKNLHTWGQKSDMRIGEACREQRVHGVLKRVPK